MCLDPDPNIKGIRTSSGELLILDCAAPLAKGCTVAVLWDGQLALVGQLLKRPHPLRHLVISFLDDRLQPHHADLGPAGRGHTSVASYGCRSRHIGRPRRNASTKKAPRNDSRDALAASVAKHRTCQPNVSASIRFRTKTSLSPILPEARPMTQLS
jgi:hypothetical protein